MRAINSAVLEGLHRNFKALFFGNWTRYAPRHPRFAMASKSSGAEEVLTWLGSSPKMRPFKGTADVAGLVSSSWKVKNEPCHNTVGVPREDIERDKLNQYGNMFKMIGTDAAKHPDREMVALLKGGFNQVDYTGVNFFGTNKPVLPGVEGSPVFTNTADWELTHGAFEFARACLGKVPDGNGEALFDSLNLTLTVGTDNLSAAEHILETATVNGTTNTLKGKAKLEYIPALGNEWFLSHDPEDGVMMPFIWQEEVAVEFSSQLEASSDEVFFRKQYAWQAYRRGKMQFLLPQCIFGSRGTTVMPPA